MLSFTGIYITSRRINEIKLAYKIIDDIKDYENHYPCIIVKSLDPDYFLLFSSISLIISEQGGPLSHLALLAMDYGIPILVIDQITSQIPRSGALLINESTVRIF